MCGPACPLHPNDDGVREPHVHPVAQRTFGGGFPLHNIPEFSKGKARALPRNPESVGRVHLAVQRDELRRREAQMGRRQPSAAIKTEGLELDMYSSGRIHKMDEKDVKEKWKIGRFLPEENKNEYGLDRRHHTVADAGRAPPAPDSRHVSAKDSVPAATRQPATHGPNPGPAVDDDDAARLAVKDSGYFSSRSENGLVRGVRKRFSTRAVMGSRYRDAQSLHSDTSQYAVNIELQTFNSGYNREDGPTSQLQGLPSPRLGKSHSAALPKHQSSTNALAPESRPFVRMSIGPSRRLERSQSVGIVRHRTSTHVFNPKNSPYANDGQEETFTLRHIQRMASSRVKERLQVIEDNYLRFKAVSKYEQITTEVFQSIGHLRGLKATLDENNSQHGGSEVEEVAWDDFLNFLESVESAIEREDARLRVVTQKRSAEKLRTNGRAEEERPREEGAEENNEDRLKRVSRVSQLTVDSFATAKEVPEIYEIPPLQTGLERSLSSPPCLKRERPASV